MARNIFVKLEYNLTSILGSATNISTLMTHRYQDIGQVTNGNESIQAAIDIIFMPIGLNDSIPVIDLATVANIYPWFYSTVNQDLKHVCGDIIKQPDGSWQIVFFGNGALPSALAPMGYTEDGSLSIKILKSEPVELNLDGIIYEDAYDILQSYLPNTSTELETQGYTKPIDTGTYIEFTAAKTAKLPIRE